MNSVFSVILSVFLFGLLILIHEFGHYFFARLFKVGIMEFSVGMGPKLFSRRSIKNGIEYSLRLLPIGGYVSMVGEDDGSESEYSLSKKPRWQRATVLGAGAAMNLLLGFIVMVVCVVSSPNIGGTTVASFSEGSSSDIDGLMVGDRIVSIEGHKVHIPYDLSYAISYYGDNDVDIVVEREGSNILLEDVSFPKYTDSGVTMGVRDFSVYAIPKNFWNVCRNSFYQCITTVRVVWESFIGLISGRFSLSAVSGPIGLTGTIKEAASSSLYSLLSLIAVITINLGIFNLFPFPGLDGGKLLFLLIEAIRGKPLKTEIEGFINFVGIAILFLLMILVTFKDIIGLF